VDATGWGSNPYRSRPLGYEHGPGQRGPGAHRARDDAPTRSRTVHEQMQTAPEFVELRRRQRRFVFPMTAAFLLWYLAYVLLACHARDLMAVPVTDGINLGLVIGLLQFVSTFVISTVYVVYARHRLDPLAEKLRARVERGELDDAGPLDRTVGRWFDDGVDDGSAGASDGTR
jgi:uncharacterized membrane protein (DUF485 family)